MRFKNFSFFFIVIALFITCNVSSASKKFTPSATGIQFIEDDWSAAIQQAKQDNKLIFLDIYATWCGPCKMLKQYTFTDKEVGDFFNKNFVNISVDGEKGVGPKLATDYAIEGYPTLIIADETGKPVLVTAGYIPAKELLRFANEALKRNHD